MSSHTGTEPTTGRLEPMEAPTNDSARRAPNYLTLHRRLPAPPQARLRRPLNVRAEALMSSPAAMTVDPHSHAGQLPAAQGGLVMTRPVEAQRRMDLHNTSINFAAAVAGQCGFTHLASGRVCRLPHRHPGTCDLRYPPALPAVAARRA